jgi:hypothetical protein
MDKVQSTPPNLQAYSQGAIQRQIVRQGLTHWLTLYPPALGLPLGFAAYLFNVPALYLAALGGAALGMGSAIINIFFRGDALSSRYLQELAGQLREQERQALEELRRELEQTRTVSGAEDYAGQAVEQLDQLRAKVDNLSRLLTEKFQQGELSYGRFLGAAEQVQMGGFDNLRRIVSLLKSVGGIDLDYLEKRLRQIDKLAGLAEADRKEREALIRRRQLRISQLEQVNELLAANEEAMTAIQETAAAVAAMSTNSPLAKGDLETAIAQLQQVAALAKHY